MSRILAPINCSFNLHTVRIRVHPEFKCALHAVKKPTLLKAIISGKREGHCIVVRLNVNDTN